MVLLFTILLTKTAAAQNEVALCYYRVRGPYFLAVIFMATLFGIFLSYIWICQARTHNTLTMTNNSLKYCTV